MTAANPLLAEQLGYYRASADDYEDYALEVPGQDELLVAIERFRPTGDVLELACGPGVWTERLVDTAKSVTAVDAAPEMLARARARVTSRRARFIEADLFTWHPDRRYDAVFFGFWLSHVPEELFALFWSLVADALNRAGQVFFFDDNYRTEEELIEGPESPVIQRQLNDGTQFRVLKVPHEPAELERRLRAMNWDISVTTTAGPFYWGIGGR